jgi:hypothetical protein
VRLPAHLTAFSNLSITRVYYLCKPEFEDAFGERQITIDGAGRLRDQNGFVRGRYAVVPDGQVVRGRVVAWNAPGHQVLVASPKGPLVLSLPKRGVDCSADRRLNGA